MTDDLTLEEKAWLDGMESLMGRYGVVFDRDVYLERRRVYVALGGTFDELFSVNLLPEFDEPIQVTRGGAV